MKQTKVSFATQVSRLSLGLSFLLAAAAPIQAALLVPTSSPNWRLFKGTVEASSPTTAWRGSNFNAAAFVTASAPFWYGDAQAGGTQLTDMVNGYTCFFLRHTFVVANVADVSALQLRALIDDGFVMWINGVEVQRFAVTDPLAIGTTLAANQAVDPAVFNDYTLPTPVTSYLVNGTNYLAVQVFNTTLGSSDIGFDCQILSVAPDFIPPTVVSKSPGPGTLHSLASITVQFNEPVSGVEATDLLINGTAAASISGTSDAYVFTFAQPAYGTVNITWAGGHNILDFGVPPNSFEPATAGNTWQYSLVDNTPPTVTPLNPVPGQTVQSLVQVEVLFSEPVQGVDAADLLVNGVPATGLTFGVPGQFLFQFASAPTGTVTISFASGHAITDLASTPNPFAGSSWTYTVDPNANPGTFRITEIMASNDNGLHDEEGDTSDWIEIYNPSTTANLQGWALTDDPGNLSKWKFPYRVLNANNYLYVFASGKNRTNVTGNLKMHTSFGLDGDGGYLALVDPAGNVVSVFNPYPAQSADISYGRDLVNPALVGVYSTPTPGTANSTRGDGIAPEVAFSEMSRAFSSAAPFSLVLSTPGVANATIHYAHGTNAPGTNTVRYTTALNISTTAVLRARAFVPGKLPGPVTTMSYIALSPASAGTLPAATNLLTFNSGLPILIIHNMGGGVIPADSEAQRPLVFQVFDTDRGRSSMTNRPNLTGRAIFHARGSSTLTSSAGKASFFFEVRGEDNDDRAVPLLGLPEESDWVLYAPNNFEPALYHNPLSHQLYRDKDRYGSRTRFFELYLQDDTNPGGSIVPGDYHGIYVLEEKIKRDKARIDIARLDVEDVTVPAVTGGYALSIDRVDASEPQFSAGGATLNWVEPNGDDMTNVLRNPQRTYIVNYLNTFNTTLTGAGWTNPLTGYTAYIDVDSWIDFHTHEVLTFNVDAFRLSGYFYKDRSQKLSYGPTWDYDRTQGSTDGRDINPRVFTVGGGTDFFNFAPWWNRLMQSPDFWQAWIDRWQELREGTNPYSTTNVIGRIMGMYNTLVESQPRERARWGIGLRTSTGGSGGTYAGENDWKINWYTNRLNYIDLQFLSKASFSITPGPLFNATEVILTPVSGVGDRRAGSQLFVSLDGIDPRLPSGGIRSGPNVLSNIPGNSITVTLSNNVRLFARCRNSAHVNVTGALNPPISSPWSGPTVGTYYFPAQTPPLRITEIMYHPSAAPPGNATNDVDNFEYVEMKNISGSPLNITGYRLRGGIEFDFPILTLAAGQACVVVADVAGYQSRYGGTALIAGAYTNKPSQNRLGNSGDHLKLEGFHHEPILDFDYSDAWYPTTDGAGFALQIANENAAIGTWGLKESWRPSASPLGSPGTNDAGAVGVVPLVISEILTHTDLPQVDAIEICNPTAAQAGLGGWFLTDNFDIPKKYRIADGVSVPANGYLVLYASNSFGSAFELGSRGEEIYLFAGDGTNLTGYVHGFDFGPQANGVTFGRYLTSQGGDQYPAQSAPTLGGANAGPKVGPIVVSEIMYRPPDISTVEGPRDNDRDEYLELENITGVPQPLFDPLSSGNTWRVRDAVSFTFPTNITIPGGGHVLLVSFDPVADPLAESTFRARNGVFGGTPIFGPYDGQLDNSSDAVELVRPDRPQPPEAPDAGAVYDILVDKVNYSHAAPWPGGADGFGFSLQRLVAGNFGNDATNWTAALKTPGYSGNSGAGPVFTQQPQSLSVLGTLPAMFSVTATGAPPIFYQWFFGNIGIPGATNSVHLIPSVTPAHTGAYLCLAQNPGGATFSSSATLTYIPPANITQQPVSVDVRVRPDPGLDVTPNTNASFTVGVTTGNPPLSYRWRMNGTNLPASPKLAGLSAATLTVSNVTIEDFGDYSCAITDGAGTIYSSNATLYPLVRPTILVASVTQTVPAFSPVAASVVLSNGFPPPFFYVWHKASNPFAVVTNDSKTNFLIIPGSIVANLSASYSVRLTNRALPTPNAANAAFFTLNVIPDADLDGMPDSFELIHSGTTNTFAPNLDADGDGMSNLAEYQAGTDPGDPNSYLRIDQAITPGVAAVNFGAISNKTYSVQFTDLLPAVNWQTLADVVSRPSNRVELLVDPAWSPKRFYRVVTPRQQP